MPDNSNGNESAYEKKIDVVSETHLEKVKVPQYWNPSGRADETKNNRKRPSIINCPSCGTPIKNGDINNQSCQYCGHKLGI